MSIDTPPAGDLELEDREQEPEFRTVETPTTYPKYRCPGCGGQTHHFPSGLEIAGVIVNWSCGECDYAARVAESDAVREADR